MRVKLMCTKEKLDEFIRAVKNDELVFSDDATFVLMEETTQKEYLLVKQDEDLLPLNINDIIYIESLQNQTLVHTPKGIFYSKEPLYQLEGELKDNGFLRVHRSYLVNRRKIERIRSAFNMKLILVMSNQDKVEVSRSYYAQFKNEIGF